MIPLFIKVTKGCHNLLKIIKTMVGFCEPVAYAICYFSFNLVKVGALWGPQMQPALEQQGNSHCRAKNAHQVQLNILQC